MRNREEIARESVSLLKLTVDVSFHEFQATVVELLQQREHGTQDVLVSLWIRIIIYLCCWGWGRLLDTQTLLRMLVCLQSCRWLVVQSSDTSLRKNLGTFAPEVVWRDFCVRSATRLWAWHCSIVDVSRVLLLWRHLLRCALVVFG